VRFCTESPETTRHADAYPEQIIKGRRYQGTNERVQSKILPWEIDEGITYQIVTKQMWALVASGEGGDALSVPGIEHTDQDEPTLLEVVLRVQGDFRSQLATLRVTPLQAGVILYLYRQREAKVTDTATGVGVAEPTLSVAVRALIRKRWLICHRRLDDRRAVCLRITQRGEVRARRIAGYVLRYEADSGQGNLLRLGQRVANGASH